ncbi:MAG TPA: hypothetical protein VKT70_08660 [Stellaceae bacterium]|nr:hypothetical protein [Stellaceae bacterium]
MDAILRQRMGIHEFTDDPLCLFRLALTASPHPLLLSDGRLIDEGEEILELHLWNEHLPQIPASGPNTAWASLMKRRVRYSFMCVAAHLESERDLDGVGAVTGAPHFASRLGALQMARTAERFGFDIMPTKGTARLHGVVESLLAWTLTWAFNPASLRTSNGLRPRYEIWISRDKFLRCYGTAADP